MPDITVDDEVFGWLQSLATPFIDTPNTVLRRMAGFEHIERTLDGESNRDAEGGQHKDVGVCATPSSMTAAASATLGSAGRGKRRRSAEARWLVRQWGIVYNGQPIQHALYHRDGSYYNHLKGFPAALLDPDGYVVFPSRESYEDCRNLRHGAQLHAQPSIKEIEGYVKVDPHLRVELRS